MFTCANNDVSAGAHSLSKIVTPLIERADRTKLTTDRGQHSFIRTTSCWCRCVLLLLLLPKTSVIYVSLAGSSGCCCCITFTAVVTVCDMRSLGFSHGRLSEVFSAFHTRATTTTLGRLRATYPAQTPHSSSAALVIDNQYE